MIKLYIIADEIKSVGLHKNLELFNIEVTWSNLNNLLSIQTKAQNKFWKCYKL